jgi:arginase family enzyme
MRPVLLDLDGALDGQAALVDEAMTVGGEVIDARDLGPRLRLWSRPADLEALRERLRARMPPDGPELVFAGSGDFHHVTPLLLERAIEASYTEPVTVIHFDNHPDWVLFDNGMHCGSWVGRAARLPGVARVITVGVCSRDIDRPKASGADLDLIAEGRLELYAYRDPRGAATVTLCGRQWPTVQTLGEAAFADLLLSRIATDAVYITIDKDVLRSEDAVTNWDQGQTSLVLLETLIQRIGERHRLIGADVVGDWSAPHYGPGLLPGLLKRGEALLDQPWRGPDRRSAGRLNEAVNQRLLRLFVQVAA